MRRYLLPVILGSLLLLTACSAPKPGVSAFTDGDSVRMEPLQYCDVQGTNCTQNGNAAGRLEAVPGKPVQISVDGEISDAPWRVEYRMLDDAGNLSAACSPLYLPGQQFSYTVRPPQGQRLQLINVYQLGGRVTVGPRGVEFGVRGTWTALTAPGAQLPKPGEALCPNVSS